MIETNLSWAMELFHAKELYHLVKEHLEAHIWYLVALTNCLYRECHPWLSCYYMMACYHAS